MITYEDIKDYIPILLVIVILIIILLYIIRPSVTPEPIDLVIPWSGENKPGDKEYSSLVNRDEGILKYSIRSIIKHAPWIRTIYIFKDPPNNYPSWLDGYRVFHKIKIIDRSLYFKNKEWCPNMNAAAIKSNIYKIDGLSENFLMLDDDTLLMNDVHYTDFFTQDMKKIIGTYTFPIGDVYPKKKIDRLKNKPPISPKKFVSGDPHYILPHKKDIFIKLYSEYTNWFDFVSSHIKRWCCNDDNICPDPDDDCKSCYDELAIYEGVPYYEAYKQNKYIYRKELPHISSRESFDFVENLTKIQNNIINITYYNINNIYTQDDYQRNNPEEFENKKLKLHVKLEEMFPEDEFYNSL